MQLQAAMAAFFRELSTFEAVSLRTALRSLAADAKFVQTSEEFLDFDARLILLRRMAFVRVVAPSSIQQLDIVLSSASQLFKHRHAIARHVREADCDAEMGGESRIAAPRPSSRPLTDDLNEQQVMPTPEQIHEYTSAAQELQQRLTGIVEEWHRDLPSAEGAV